MRRVQLAAVAIGIGVLAVTVLTRGALAGQIGLSNTFPASRIQLDVAPATADMPRRSGDPPTKTTITAVVEDWHGATVSNVLVGFTIVSGPNKGRSLTSSRTNNKGRASVSYANGPEPGIDAVQASFTDGLEVHRSNRHFVLWLSGPSATAIRSPATITAKPNCFQPAAAVTLSSDTFKALASTTLESSNNAFLSLAKETFDKVLAEARGDLGKREEAITGLVKPLAESLKTFDERFKFLRQRA